jgi:hypothetical protein
MNIYHCKENIEKKGKNQVDSFKKKLERLIYCYDMMLYIYFNEYTGLNKDVDKKRFEHFYKDFYAIIKDDYDYDYEFATDSYESVLRKSFSVLESEIKKNSNTKDQIIINTHPIVDSTFVENFYNIPNSYLEIFKNICNDLFSVNDYFEIVLLNGSYGSHDYRFGWSDIDIFCVLKKDILLNKQKLSYLRDAVLKIVDNIYLFNIYQLHGVFMTSPATLDYHLQRSLPTECIKNGIVFGGTNAITINRINTNKESNLNYLEHDIVKTYVKYISSDYNSVMAKINILHSIFSFPFAFLQAVEGSYYKKESFEIIKKYKHILTDIDKIYNYFNKFYYSWPKGVDMLTLSNRFSELQTTDKNIQSVNKAWVEKETNIKNIINSFFELEETKLNLQKIKDNMLLGVQFARKNCNPPKN